MRFAGQLGQPAGAGVQPLLLAQRFFFAGLQGRALDLDGLVLERLAPALVLAAVAAQRVQGGLDLAQAPVRLGQGRRLRVEAGVTVHEVEVRLRIEEALRLVLAVDVGQRTEPARAARRRGRGRR